MSDTRALLHVEDSESMIRAVEMMLEKYPIEFESVLDGHQALERVHDHAYDCILLDLDMPVMDGLEFLRNFNKRNYQSIILVCSARHDLKSINDAIKLGASDYIMKPFTEDILIMKLRKLNVL